MFTILELHLLAIFLLLFSGRVWESARSEDGAVNRARAKSRFLLLMSLIRVSSINFGFRAKDTPVLLNTN
jgi:hypothetical protein